MNTRASFTVDRAGARLAVVTPFETVRFVVDIDVGNFECASGPPQAFELAWTRDSLGGKWLQQLSEFRLGPLVVHGQGRSDAHIPLARAPSDRSPSWQLG